MRIARFVTGYPLMILWVIFQTIAWFSFISQEPWRPGKIIIIILTVAINFLVGINAALSRIYPQQQRQPEVTIRVLGVSDFFDEDDDWEDSNTALIVDSDDI